jgi:hypothetical protein
MHVIGRPQLFVRTCRPQFVTPATQSVEEQQRAPAINQLSLGIQGDVLTG